MVIPAAYRIVYINLRATSYITIFHIKTNYNLGIVINIFHDSQLYILNIFIKLIYIILQIRYLPSLKKCKMPV